MRPMSAALADAIADDVLLSGVVLGVLCGEVCSVGSCVEFFTYLLVVTGLLH